MRFNHSFIGKVLSSIIHKISEEQINRKVLRKEVPLIFRDLGVFVLIFSLILLPVPMTASASTDKKWGPHIDITGKLGNERSLGDVDFMIPVLQGSDSMFFLDLRFQRDDKEAKEGNFGLGYRQMMSDWILGGYGFFDERESQYDNTFRQWTLGVEALSESYDARFNLYLADEDEEEISGLGGVDTFTYMGSNLMYGGSFEKSLSGFDFEVGGVLPGLVYPEIRAYVGGFYFDASDVDKLTGPKGRLEVRFPDMFGWDGSLFEVGGEVRDDSERDTDYYFTARLRIPFGTGTFAQPTSSLTNLEKRMTERVVRDPDIVTVREGGSGIQALTYNSVAIDFTHVDDAGAGGAGTIEDPYGTLTDAAGADSDIVLLHADSVFDGEEFAMADDQRLLGDSADANYVLETDQFGSIVLPHATSGTGAPVIQNAPSNAITAGNNTEISGINIIGAATRSIFIDSLTGPVDIRDINIDGGGSAFGISNSSGAITIADSNTTPGQKGFEINNSSADIFMYNSTVFADNNLALDMSNDTGTFYMDENSSITAINDNGAEGMSFSNSDGSYTFDGAVALTGTDTGLAINGSTSGDFNFNNLTITDPADGSRALSLNGNAAGTTIDIAGPSSITVNSDAQAINVSNGDLSTLNIASTVPITAYNGAGMVFNNADGTYNFFAPVVLDGSGTGGDTGIDVTNGSDGNITFYDAVTINNPVGAGINIDNSGGTETVTFTDAAPLTITTGNDNGIYAQSDGTLIVAGTGNTIDATGGQAIHAEDNTIDLSFDSVSSTDSTSGGSYDAGVALYSVTGTGTTNGLLVSGPTTVYNSAASGIFVQDFEGDIALGSVIVDTTVEEGLLIDFNRPGTFVAGTTDVSNTGDTGIYVTNHVNSATFGDTTVANSGNNGIEIVSNDPGSVVTFNSVAISNSANTGLHADQNNGTLIVNEDTLITDSGARGLWVEDNSGDVELNGALNVYNSALAGVSLTNNGIPSITTGDFTVEGPTSVYNSGINGIEIIETDGMTSFASTSVYNSTVDGIHIDGILNTATFGPTLVSDTGSNGIYVANTSVGGDVTYNSLEINDAGTNGIAMENMAGNFVVTNTTDINDPQNSGIVITNSSGDATFTEQTTIYNAGTTAGDGVNIANSTGTFTFNELDITTVNGSGLVASNVNNLIITDPNSDNSIVANNGNAIDIDNSTIDVTYNTVTSNDSTAEGILLDTVAGTLDITDSANIYNAAAVGIDILSSSADVTIANITVDMTGQEGILLEGNSGTFTAGPTNVYNTATVGIDIDSISNSATFGPTLVSDTGDYGIYVHNTVAGGDVTFADTSVYNSASAGIFIENTNDTVTFADTLVYEAADSDGVGSVRIISNNDEITFGDTTVTARHGDGVYIQDANAAISFDQTVVNTVEPAADNLEQGIWVNGGTAAGDVTFNSVIITASNDNGIRIDGPAAGDFTVLHTTDITDSAANGIVINGMSGDATFTEQTTIYNAGTTAGDGVNIANSTGTFTFNELDITTVNGSGLVASNVNNLIVTDPNSDNSIVANNGNAIDIDNSTIDVTYNTVTSNNSPAEGILLDTVAGTLDITDSANIYNSATTGIEVANSSVNVFIDTANVTGSGEEGILLESNSGTYNSATVTVTDSGFDGILVDSVTGDVTIDHTNVYNSATGSGLVVYNTTNTSHFGDTVVMDADGTPSNGVEVIDSTGSFTFDGLNVVTNDGSGLVVYNSANVNVLDTDGTGNNIVANGGSSTEGASLDIYNSVINLTFDNLSSTDSQIEGLIVEGSSGSLTVNNATEVYNSALSGVAIYNTPTLSSMVNVTMNTITIDGSGDIGGVAIIGNGGTFSANETSVNDSTLGGIVIGNNYNTVTFNETVQVTNSGGSPGAGIAIGGNTDTVTFNGPTSIYNTTGIASLLLAENTGDVDFNDTLDINLTTPTGPAEGNGILVFDNPGALTVDGATTVYNSLGTDGVSISNSGDVAFNSTLDVRNSNEDGIYLDSNTGSFEVVGATTVYNSGTNGINIENNLGTIAFAETTVDDSAVDGIHIDGIMNTATFGPTLVTNSGDDGVEVINTDALGDVTYNSLAVYESGDDGITLDNNSGDFTVLNTTSVYNSANDGVYIANNAGTVDFDSDLTINMSGNDGMRIIQNYNTVTVAGTTNIYNTTNLGLGMRGNEDTITFQDDVNVIKTELNDGIQITNNIGDVFFEGNTQVVDAGLIGIDIQRTLPVTTGTVDFVGSTTVYNSADRGISITRASDTVTFTGPTVVYNSGSTGVAIAQSADVDINGGLQITTLDGEGIFIRNNNGTVTVVDSPATDNFIVSTGGTGGAGFGAGGDAIVVLNSDVDMTFDNLTSTDSEFNGVYLDGMTGSLTVNEETNITGALAEGMYIDNLADGSTVTYNVVTIGDSASDGVYLSNIDGTVTFTGPATIYNSGLVDNLGSGVYAVGGTGTGSVTFEETLDITNSYDQGIFIGTFDGTFDVVGKTTITDSGGAGIEVSGSAGDVTFGELEVTDTGVGFDGILLDTNTGTFVAGTTTVTNAGDSGISIDTISNSATFGDTTIYNAAGIGISVANTTAAGTTTFGDTTIVDRNDIGISIDSADAAVAFNNVDIQAPKSGTGAGFYMTNTTSNGDVTYNTLTIDGSNEQGLFLENNSGDLVAINSTNVYNSASGFAAVEINNSAGAVDLGTVDIHTTAYNAAGLVTNGIIAPGSLTIDGGDILTENATAIDLINTVIGAGGVTFDSVTSNNATNADGSGVVLEGVTGGDFTATTVTTYNSTITGFEITDSTVNVTVGTTDVSLTGAEGVLIYNSAGNIDLGDLTVDTTGADGVALYNSSGLTIDGGSIDNTTGDGIFAKNTDLTVGNATIGATAIGGDGIEILNDAATDHEVAIYNTVISNVTGAGITMEGTAGGGTLYITNLADLTVTDAAAGGILVNSATLDASGVAALGTQVSGGDTTIGDTVTTTDITGDGLRLDQVLGDIAYGNLDIGNDNGTGIYIRDDGGKGGTFAFSTASGTVNTTNGTAIDIDPVALGMTLDSVSSSDAAGAGIIMDAVSGTVNIGTVDIDNSGTEGVSISNSTAAITIGKLDVNTSGSEGIALSDNDGSFTVTGTTTVDDAGGAAIAVYNSAVTDSVNFGTTNITGRNAEGVAIYNTAGSIGFGATTIGFPAGGTAAGVSVADTTGGGVTFNSLAIGFSNGEGVALSDNAGDFTVTGATTIDSSNGTSINITGTGPGDYTGNVSFGSTNITNRFAEGIVVENTESDIGFGVTTVTGFGSGAVNEAAVSVYNTAALSNVTFSRLTATGGAGTGLVLTDNEGDTRFGNGSSISAMSGGNAFTVDGGSGDVTYNGGIFNEFEGYLVEVTDRNGGEIVLNNTISATSGGSSKGIYIHDNAAGDVTFNGLVISAPSIGESALVIYNSLGSTNFDGGLRLISNAATALDVKGGGELNITGSGNSIKATNGQAISIDGDGGYAVTGIHLNSVTLDEVDSSNSSSHGIFINDVVDNSTFIVTGAAESNIRDVDNNGIYITNAGQTTDASLFSFNNVTIEDNPAINGLTMDSGVELFNNEAEIYLNDVNIFNYLVDDILDSGGQNGTVTLKNSATLNATTGGLLVTSGDASFDFNFAINHTGGPGSYAVEVEDGHAGTINFLDDITDTNGDGMLFTGADGAYNFASGTTIDLLSGSLEIIDSDGDFDFAGIVTTSETVTITGGTADVSFADLNVSDTAAEGILAQNTGSLTISGGSIYNTVTNGVEVLNTDLTMDNVTLGGSTGIGNMGISAVYNSTGVTNTVDISNITIENAGDMGIGIASYNGATVNATLTDNNVTSTNSSLVVIDTDPNTVDADTGNVVLSMSGNTYNSAAIPTVSVTGSSYNSVIVTDMSDTTILGGQGGGGMIYNTVTFDAGGGAQVNGGTTTIGTTTDRVNGNGLLLIDPSGDLGITQLDIANDGAGAIYNGAGLAIDAKSTIFNFDNGGGTIDTINGNAVFIDPVTTNGMVFDTINSTDSTGNGVLIDGVSGGTVDLGDVTINNSAEAGIEVINTTSDVTYNSATINNSGAEGILLDNMSGAFNSDDTTSITNSLWEGVYIQNSSATVNFDTLDIDNTLAPGALGGVRIENNTGDLTVNSLTVEDTTHGVYANNVGNVAFGSVDINNSNGAGIYFEDGDSLSVTGGTVYNSASQGIYAINTDLTVINTSVGSVTTPTGTVGGGSGVSLTASTPGTYNAVILGNDIVAVNSGIYLATGSSTINALVQGNSAVTTGGPTYNSVLIGYGPGEINLATTCDPVNPWCNDVPPVTAATPLEVDTVLAAENPGIIPSTTKTSGTTGSANIYNAASLGF